MRDLNLVLLLLLVSCVSWVFQAAAFARMAAGRPGGHAEGLIGRAHLRTVGCRVLAATVYVVVAAVQLAGAGTLTPEALLVFTSVQGLWITNTLLDMRLRRTLTRTGGPGMADGSEKETLAKIAAVTDELDATIDRLFVNAAELRKILTALKPAAPRPLPEQETP